MTSIKKVTLARYLLLLLITFLSSCAHRLLISLNITVLKGMNQVHNTAVMKEVSSGILLRVCIYCLTAIYWICSGVVYKAIYFLLKPWERSMLYGNFSSAHFYHHYHRVLIIYGHKFLSPPAGFCSSLIFETVKGEKVTS